MIPSPTKALSGETLQSDPLGSQRVTKKKGSEVFSSLFSSLLEKAGTPKGEGEVRALAAAGVKAERAPNRGAEPAEKGAPDTTKKSNWLPAKERLAENTTRASAGKKPTVGAGELKAAVPPAGVQIAEQKTTLSKDGKAGDTAAEPADSGASRAKLRASESRKKERLIEAADASAETLAAASASVAAQAAQKNASKAEAPAKSDERLEAVEGKKKDKRKDRLEIEVFDQRRGESYGAAAGGARPAFGGDSGPGDSTAKNGTDLVLTLREGSGESRADASDSSRSASGQKTSFADALSRELRETYNGDIVQRASVVLKDGGDGLIRLSLRPESLGSVKIKLELADNKIAGKILVETEEALKAFGKELRSLEQAFIDGGFDGASLELALSSGDSGTGSGRKDGGDAPRPFFSDRLIATEYDAAVPSADAGIRPIGVREDTLVDMLA